MRAVIQRIERGVVSVGGEVVGSAGTGLFVLLGVAAGDTKEDAELLAGKISRLRIFGDESGKMNRSLCDIAGDALVVSNFTLLANCRRGNRPDFLGAAPPDEAEALYEYFLSLLREVPGFGRVGAGRFGAHMEISLSLDGPVTIAVESGTLKKSSK